MRHTGITIQSGEGGTLIRFDTRRPEARKAILASLDRLAEGAVVSESKPVPVSEETLAAVRAKHPGAAERLIRMEAQIASTFFGGRV